MAPERPLPVLTDENRPFWEAAARGELRMQRCVRCGHVRYPITPVCTRCLAPETEWTALSGRGTVASYVVFHQVYHQAFKDAVPYNAALIQLEEGPRMMSNVVGIPNDALAVGMPVEVVFTPLTQGIHLPQFRPRREAR